MIESMRRGYRKWAALAAEKKILAIGSEDRELFFRKSVDAVPQMSRWSPFLVPVEADVQIASRVRLSAGAQFSGPMTKGGTSEPTELNISIFPSDEM